MSARDCNCFAERPEHVHADTCPAWQDCPDCDGTGEVADYWNGLVGCWETKRCPSCNGQAWMLVRDVVALLSSRCEHYVPHDYEYGCADCDRERLPVAVPDRTLWPTGWESIPPPF